MILLLLLFFSFPWGRGPCQSNLYNTYYIPCWELRESFYHPSQPNVTASPPPWFHLCSFSNPMPPSSFSCQLLKYNLSFKVHLIYWILPIGSHPLSSLSSHECFFCQCLHKATPSVKSLKIIEYCKSSISSTQYVTLKYYYVITMLHHGGLEYGLWDHTCLLH